MEPKPHERIHYLLLALMDCMDLFQVSAKKGEAETVFKKIEEYEKEVKERNIIASLSVLSEIFSLSKFNYLAELSPYRTHYFTSKRLNDSEPYLELILTTMQKQVLIFDTENSLTSKQLQQQMTELKSVFFSQMNQLLMLDEDKKPKCFALSRFISKNEKENGLLKRIKLNSMKVSKAMTMIDIAFEDYFKQLEVPIGLTFCSELHELLANGISSSNDIDGVLKLLEVLEDKEPDTTSEEKRKERQNVIDRWLINKEEAEKAETEKQKMANELSQQSEEAKQKRKDEKEKMLMKKKQAAERKEEEERLKNEVKRQAQQLNLSKNQAVSSSNVKEKERVESIIPQAPESKQEDMYNAIMEKINVMFALRDSKIQALQNNDEASQKKIEAVQTILNSQENNLNKAFDEKYVTFCKTQAIKHDAMKTELQNTMNETADKTFDSKNINVLSRIKALETIVSRLKSYLRLLAIRTWCRGFLLRCKEKYNIEDQYDAPKSLQASIIKAIESTDNNESLIEALKYCATLAHHLNLFAHQATPESINLIFDANGGDQFIKDSIREFLSPLKDTDLMESLKITDKDVNSSQTLNLIDAYENFMIKEGKVKKIKDGNVTSLVVGVMETIQITQAYEQNLTKKYFSLFD